jgi:hypothetical protein
MTVTRRRGRATYRDSLPPRADELRALAPWWLS